MQAWYPWFFFAQPEKPERAIHEPATVRAMLEDHSAGLGVDRATDEADRKAGRRIACRVLVVWSEHDDLEELYGEVITVWNGWADDVRGASIAGGHHLAEEAPHQLEETLRALFS